MTTKSLSFLFPALGLHSDTRKAVQDAYDNGLVNCFAGDTEDELYKEWGEFLYLSFKEDLITDAYLNILEDHEFFRRSYQSKKIKGEIVFVYKFDTYHQEQIYDKFIGGEYSKICRKYVKKYFPRRYKDGEVYRVSYNWRVLNKDSYWKNYYEELIGVKIPEDAEYFPKPEMKDEIRNFIPEVEIYFYPKLEGLPEKIRRDDDLIKVWQWYTKASQSGLRLFGEPKSSNDNRCYLIEYNQEEDALVYVPHKDGEFTKVWKVSPEDRFELETYFPPDIGLKLLRRYT